MPLIFSFHIDYLEVNAMRILVVGAGATGGYFGGRLALAGRDVTFLVRSKRAAVLRAEGMQIITPAGKLTLQPQVAEAGTLDQPFDLVIIAVKAYALASALTDVAPAVRENTLILPLLNGMKHLQAISARFGDAALIGGLCKIVSSLDSEGRIVQMTDLDEFTYGELDGTVTERITRLDHCLQNAGFTARLSSDIKSEMWEKWLLLASLGAITCLMRGNIGQVAAAPGGAQFARSMVDEITALLVSAGYRRRQDYVDQIIGLLTQTGSTQTSSMYRDLTQGYEIEADHIVGDLLAIGQRAGIASPLLSAAYTHLSVYRAARNIAR
jgi:2-dehydropantoate 2-reductase